MLIHVMTRHPEALAGIRDPVVIPGPPWLSRSSDATEAAEKFKGPVKVLCGESSLRQELIRGEHAALPRD